MLTQMDVGGVMACTHDQGPLSKRISPMFPRLFTSAHLNPPIPWPCVRRGFGRDSAAGLTPRIRGKVHQPSATAQLVGTCINSVDCSRRASLRANDRDMRTVWTGDQHQSA